MSVEFAIRFTDPDTEEVVAFYGAELGEVSTVAEATRWSTHERAAEACKVFGGAGWNAEVVEVVGDSVREPEVNE